MRGMEFCLLGALEVRDSNRVVALGGPRQRLDLHRFEGLLDAGSRALADGRRSDAAALLRKALALWRGPALADFAYERFAQAEIARLEELRLLAIERRIDADLACVLHAGDA